MIYTITFNPSIDYFVDVEDFDKGKVNRAIFEECYIGGNGINISRVLCSLGIESTALGFVSGFTGNEIINNLDKNNIKHDFVVIDRGFSRINIKIGKNDITCINGSGPIITEDYFLEFLKKIDNITEKDLVIIGGRLAKGITYDDFKMLCSRLDKKNIKYIVDCDGKQLLRILECNPYLIKIRNWELEQLFDIKIKGINNIKVYMKELQKRGANNILVSLGSKGAIFLNNEGKFYFVSAPKIKVINDMAAGDSLLAGFVAGIYHNEDYQEALKLGVACGSATASSMDLGVSNQINQLLEKIEEN